MVPRLIKDLQADFHHLKMSVLSHAMVYMTGFHQLDTVQNLLVHELFGKKWFTKCDAPAEIYLNTDLPNYCSLVSYHSSAELQELALYVPSLKCNVLTSSTLRGFR